MARSRKNFLSILNDEKISVFCAYDRDYSLFRGQVLEENLFENLGFSGIKKCVFMDQIHSNIVQIYNDELYSFRGDGLISDERGVALCVLSADCLPLLLWHKSGVVAALHSGRQGSFENILASCVNMLKKINAKLKNDDFKLFIMPSICQKHYELGGEVLDYAKEHFHHFLNDKKLDLKALVANQAQNLGINEILDLKICTFEDENFPSYRRDKTNKRFVSVIVLKD